MQKWSAKNSPQRARAAREDSGGGTHRAVKRGVAKDVAVGLVVTDVHDSAGLTFGWFGSGFPETASISTK